MAFAADDLRRNRRYAQPQPRHHRRLPAPDPCDRNCPPRRTACPPACVPASATAALRGARIRPATARTSARRPSASACMPWVRPTVGVRRNSSARRPRITRSAAMSSSSSADASFICSAKAVSTTSERRQADVDEARIVPDVTRDHRQKRDHVVLNFRFDFVNLRYREARQGADLVDGFGAESRPARRALPPPPVPPSTSLRSGPARSRCGPSARGNSVRSSGALSFLRQRDQNQVHVVDLAFPQDFHRQRVTHAQVGALQDFAARPGPIPRDGR